MALEAEVHYSKFLELQAFIESSDETVLSKIKLGKIY